jgi:hypothetical protein
VTEPQFAFRYADLKDVDPNFTLLDGPEVYSFRITKAELTSYTAKTTNKNQTAGDEVDYVKLTLTVTNHPKFSGRKLWEPLFPGDFSLKTLKRIEEATGIVQTGSMESWLAEVSQIQPTIKAQVDQVPDLMKEPGTGNMIPNPKTVKSDGTAGLKNVVNWRSGVQPE